MTTGSGSRGARLRERLSGHHEVAAAVILLAAFAFLRLRIDAFVPPGRGRTVLPPDAWPGAILTLAVVLSAAYLVQTLRRALGGEALLPTATPLGPTADDAEAVARAAEADNPDAAQLWRLAAGFGLLFAYIYLMSMMGFVPVTVLFCVAFLLMVGERRWWMVAAIPAAVTVVVLVVFTRVLVVPLPRGQGVFLEFSTFLY
jgi:putative tricarboxylic transport membrane protein